MFLAITLGGASRYNDLQVTAIELVSLPLLALALWRITGEPLPASMKLPLIILAGAFGILIFQLIPLPGFIWSNLPGRSLAAEARMLTGGNVGWSPISLNPGETLLQLLAMVPPAAVFLATALLPSYRKRWLTLIPLGLAVVSIGIGAIQVAQGNGSNFYFYQYTDVDSAVGLFANRNHQATLLVSTLPLAALWLRLDRNQARLSALPVTAALAVFMMAIIALIVVKSRAGVLLLAPALLGSMMLILRGERGEGRPGATLFAGIVALALFLGIGFGMGPVLERFSDGLEQGSSGGRLTAALTTARAALEHLPFGSGAGTFVQIFPAYESIENMSPKFWNHAHNDYLEVLMATGLLGLAVMALFGFWWLMRAWGAWSQPTSQAANLACAGSLTTALILLHSTVDYPLRTLAIGVIFAFACGLMVNNGAESHRRRRRRH